MRKYKSSLAPVSKEDMFELVSFIFIFSRTSTNSLCRLYRKWIRRVFKNLKICATLFSVMLGMEAPPKLDQCLNQYA